MHKLQTIGTLNREAYQPIVAHDFRAEQFTC